MLYPDLQHATIQQLQDGLTAGHFTSVQLVKAYISRIQEVNPVLNAVISISPAALRAAHESDEERRQGKVRSILEGIPIAVKDNIATRAEDGMDTTAGSFALQGAIVPGDATCVARLREAGAIILSKTNLSVFGNFRGVGSGAWSPVGGQCTSPYFRRGTPTGSSSGSAVAVAAGLVTVAIGGDTGGSIIAPASRCALVGIRPTVGLVPQDGGVPISSSRDVFGPMSRTVLEGATVLEVMAGRIGSLTGSLSDRLDGVRLLVPTNLRPPSTTHWANSNFTQRHKHLFDEACRKLRDLGAELIEVEVSEDFIRNDHDLEAKTVCMETEFAQEIEEYLASLTHVPSGVRTLKDLIQYTKDDPRESPAFYDTCNTFESALARPGLDSEQYRQAKKSMDQSKGLIDAELKKYSAQAFVMMSTITYIWSNAGWPQVTVPSGFLGPETHVVSAQVTDKHGVTVDAPLELYKTYPNQGCGVTFAGSGFSESTLINIAYAFEQATNHRALGKTYPEATAKTQLVDVLSCRM